MELSLTTPALLFPAISLLMLAYTNRFIVLAQLVRDLHSKYRLDSTGILKGQIQNLRTRLRIIKYMQMFGAVSFFCCVVAMLLVFVGRVVMANVTFGLSLFLLLVSLGMLLLELHLSIDALDIQLDDFEK